MNINYYKKYLKYKTKYLNLNTQFGGMYGNPMDVDPMDVESDDEMPLLPPRLFRQPNVAAPNYGQIIKARIIPDFFNTYPSLFGQENNRQEHQSDLLNALNAIKINAQDNENYGTISEKIHTVRRTYEAVFNDHAQDFQNMIVHLLRQE
jgi:hypothetical protein